MHNKINDRLSLPELVNMVVVVGVEVPATLHINIESTNNRLVLLKKSSINLEHQIENLKDRNDLFHVRSLYFAKERKCLLLI